MRSLRLSLLLIASLSLSGCADFLERQQPPAKWTTGFWLWPGGAAEAMPSGTPLDVLFVHAGTIHQESARSRLLYGLDEPADGEWRVYGRLPDPLPAAREYWLVFRHELQAVPDLEAAPVLARVVSQLREAANRRQLNVVGVQLDIDSPTRFLPRYAGFLHEFRKQLPPGFEVSITALLDWFRDGTDIADVVKEVDEFVPQFYDVANRSDYGGGTAIAARIDAAKWGPAFNRFEKRFRVGISTFGRARLIRRTDPSRPSYRGIGLYRDLAPLDIATDPAFRLQATRNDANELVLNYEAERETAVGYSRIKAGDAIQFILSTPETVRAAVESVKEMGGYAAGVIFFRWPGSVEELVMPPDEVLAAADSTSPEPPRRPVILAVDGGCAAVSCVGLFLEGGLSLSPQPVRYSIRSSVELEYFLPEENMPIRMAGPSGLELSLPPYCGQSSLYLGRAVTVDPSEFTVDEEQ